MDAIGAAKDTMDAYVIPIKASENAPVNGPFSAAHLASMYTKMVQDEMSYGKQCRWLGWMQAAVVSWGVATLDDMKQINRRRK